MGKIPPVEQYNHCIMGKILQGSNLTITSWAKSSREQFNHYTMGKIL
jgi:hypothetical protein